MLLQHSHYNQTIEYVEIAQKYNLLITCGSDFHGEKIKPDVKIGVVSGDLSSLDYDKIADLLKRASR